MKRIYLLFLLSVIFMTSARAQQLLSPTFSFSHKKTAYITLKDGTEVKGNLKDVDRKDGLIKQIKVKDGNGKNIKLKPENVKYMYLPPNNLDKLRKGAELVSDVQKWTNDKLDQDLLHQGYAYFENANVKMKKKTIVMLMQLLNPDFCTAVKVFHDPEAKETASLGIGGVTMVGGKAKSYYLQFGDDAAFKLQKGKYKKEFIPLWDKCESVKAKYGADVKWNELVKHILEYTENCK